MAKSKHRGLTPAERKLPVRQRQFKHVYENLLAKGKPEAVAKKVAAMVVNKTRARFSREGRGPKLVREGGTRRGWYPGKKGKTAKARRAALRCLTHHRGFKTRAGYLSHMRSRAHGRKHRK